MGVRRKGREFALQALYLSDVTKTPAVTAIRQVTQQENIDADVVSFAEKLVKGVDKHREAIDEALKTIAANWDLYRMAAIDRNILRMGAYELLHHKDTPPSVVIDEAIEIAKLFSTPDSGRFVNGILDKILSTQKKG